MSELCLGVLERSSRQLKQRSVRPPQRMPAEPRRADLPACWLQMTMQQVGIAQRRFLGGREHKCCVGYPLWVAPSSRPIARVPNLSLYRDSRVNDFFTPAALSRLRFLFCSMGALADLPTSYCRGHHPFLAAATFVQASHVLADEIFHLSAVFPFFVSGRALISCFRLSQVHEHVPKFVAEESRCFVFRQMVKIRLEENKGGESP